MYRFFTYHRLKKPTKNTTFAYKSIQLIIIRHMGSEGFQYRYINPYTDFGFKKLFGTELNKDLLISIS